MAAISAIHLLSAIAALASGLAVLLLPKGTRRHRILGRTYFFSMLILNVTALSIFRLFDGFGPFHAAALASLATIVPGVLEARRKRPGWLQRHYFFMTFSYVGLLAAAASEMATRVPEAPFWEAVALATFAIMAVGGMLIFRMAPRAARMDGAPASAGAIGQGNSNCAE
jgi:uncharacterized membrane protein